MKKKILITEDDPALQDVFKLIFEKAGYHTTIFSSGRPIFDDSYDYPDIYLLDRFLSGYDGLDICRYLKNNETTQNIPVVMISASPDLAHMAQQAGADDFLEKPFKIKDLLSLVAKHIHKVPTE